MARQRIVKTVRKSNTPSNSLVKDLNPRDPDSQYFGPEPNFADGQPIPEKRLGVMIDSLNWYSRFYSNKEAKEFLVSYLENRGIPDKLKLVRKAPESKVITSMGWLARMALRGLELDIKEIARVNQHVDDLIIVVKGEDKVAKEEEAKPKVERKNIQEIMREKASDAAGELEGFFDEFCIAEYPKDFETRKRVMAEFQERNILPQHVGSVIAHWEKVKAEYEELQKGKCPQLNEAYSNMSKAQVKNMLKFIESVIADLNGYISVKQSVKRVRVRKAIPVERVVAKLKHLKAFKDEATKLDLVGLPPVKLHNATEAWVYDTAKRKMHHYVADEYSKCLMVKGSTLLGFDKKQSEVKTLRKPAEQIKELTGSKPAARKYFKDIKAVATSPNGRFNDKMIILKAF